MQDCSTYFPEETEKPKVESRTDILGKPYTTAAPVHGPPALLALHSSCLAFGIAASRARLFRGGPQAKIWPQARALAERISERKTEAPTGSCANAWLRVLGTHLLGAQDFLRVHFPGTNKAQATLNTNNTRDSTCKQTLLRWSFVDQHNFRPRRIGGPFFKDLMKWHNQTSN